jgi:hypothetical protein
MPEKGVSEKKAQRHPPLQSAKAAATPNAATGLVLTETIIQRTLDDPRSLTVADGMRLQRALGNQAVGRLLRHHNAGQPAQPSPLIQRQGDDDDEGFQPFSGQGHRLGDGGNDAPLPLDAETLRKRRLEALERRLNTPQITPPQPQVEESEDEGGYSQKEMQRFQQVLALRRRGLIGGGFTYGEHRSTLNEQMEARDEAAQNRAVAVTSFAPVAKVERDWNGLKEQIAKARIIDEPTVTPLENALRDRIDKARGASPDQMNSLVGPAETAYNALKTEVERIIQEQQNTLQAITDLLNNQVLKAQREKAYNDAKFDTTQIKALAQAMQRKKKAAFDAETATKQNAKDAHDAVLALDARVTDDLEFLRMIEKAPGGMTSLDDGSAFANFRTEFRQKAVAAWAAFKTEAAKEARVKATCLAELTTVTEFFVTADDLAKKVKGKTEVAKKQSVDKLLDLDPIKAYSPQGNDKYMLGKLLDTLPSKTAEGADAQELTKLLKIPNVDAGSLLGWMTPPTTTGPEIPTPAQAMDMLRWANDGTAFGRLRTHFTATLMSQLYPLLQRCQGEGPALKYLAVDKNKDYAWLDELTQEHKASTLKDYLVANGNQRFWRAGATCAPPATDGGKTIDQIITDARQLTRGNRNTLIANGDYVGNRPFKNLGTIDDVQPNGDVNEIRCMALPTHRGGRNISYKEYDLKVFTGANRGAERFVVGSDGSRYHTDDHYASFNRFQDPI